MDVTTLIRKSSKTRSPHPSRIRLLDDHRDPVIPWISGVEIKSNVLRKSFGFIYSPDRDNASQNRNMLQCSSSVLSPVYMRFVDVICYRDENDRRHRGTGRR